MSVVVALAGDVYFLGSRCECSPEIYASGVVVGLLVQAAAISIPLIVDHLFHDSACIVRLRAVGIGLLVCIGSLPLMETAILFGDSIGQRRGPSMGYTCGYSRVFPDRMAPSKVQARCGTPVPGR